MSVLPHRVVLVEPELPENIGFCVRAMACFGWSRLVLVGVPRPEPESAAWRTATLGKEILESCETVPTLLDAFGDARTTVAFTRRPHRKGLVDLPDFAAASGRHEAPWAFVFGRESIGLTSEEVLACDQACTIPTAHPTGSFNLGQAVAIALAYAHERPAKPSADPRKGTALAALRETWVRQALQDAETLQLLHPSRQEAGRRHLASLLRRLRPSREELRFLGAVFARLAREAGGSRPRPPQD